jgi:hypothetical protein
VGLVVNPGYASYVEFLATLGLEPDGRGGMRRLPEVEREPEATTAALSALDTPPVPDTLGKVYERAAAEWWRVVEKEWAYVAEDIDPETQTDRMLKAFRRRARVLLAYLWVLRRSTTDAAALELIARVEALIVTMDKAIERAAQMQGTIASAMIKVLRFLVFVVDMVGHTIFGGMKGITDAHYEAVRLQLDQLGVPRWMAKALAALLVPQKYGLAALEKVFGVLHSIFVWLVDSAFWWVDLAYRVGILAEADYMMFSELKRLAVRLLEFLAVAKGARALGGLAKRSRIRKGADPTVPRLPVPETPGGMSISSFGKLMKWGTGEAAALARVPKLSRGFLERAGVTRAMAEAWARFYRNEMRRVPDNASARGRAVLMEEAARLLR